MNNPLRSFADATSLWPDVGRGTMTRTASTRSQAMRRILESRQGVNQINRRTCDEAVTSYRSIVRVPAAPVACRLHRNPVTRVQLREVYAVEIGSRAERHAPSLTSRASSPRPSDTQVRWTWGPLVSQPSVEEQPCELPTFECPDDRSLEC